MSPLHTLFIDFKSYYRFILVQIIKINLTNVRLTCGAVRRISDVLDLVVTAEENIVDGSCDCRVSIAVVAADRGVGMGNGGRKGDGNLGRLDLTGEGRL